jgi:DNA-binding LacI/PurR family transcriptional regulator
MGEKAAALLFKAIEKKTKLDDETFVIKSTLHARSSTG